MARFFGCWLYGYGDSLASCLGTCIYLVIGDRVIEEVKFYTKGCLSTIVCGKIVAQLSLDKTVDEALGISPKQIIKTLKGLPKEHSHCSILAVSTLYRAIANYLIKPR